MLNGYDCELSVVQSTLPPAMMALQEIAKPYRERVAERYRPGLTSPGALIFHSSYYRLPSDRKIPAVTTVHDFTYERLFSGPKRWVHSMQKNQAIRNAAAVICVSENTRSDLFEFLPEVKKEKVHVVYNGAGNTFTPLQCPRDLNAKETYVIFVGSRVWYKNFSVVVAAMKSLPYLNLVCVGGGTFLETETGMLEQVIPGRYRHEGNVDDVRLNYLYNNALCLVYPSSYEGFGIPVLEAMKAGCPVIALRSSAIPEIAGNAAVLIDKADPELLASAVTQLTDHDVREELRIKGFQQAQAFSWENTFLQTIQIYEEVLGYSLPRSGRQGEYGD